MAAQDPASKLGERERELVRWARVARLATVGADGTPHVVPVCPLLEDDTVYLASADEGPKVRNMRERPDVAIVVDDPAEDWDLIRGVLIRGRAREVGEAEFERLRSAFYEKYLVYEQKAPLGADDSTIFGISIDRVTSWWEL
jgi:PPOX class probable F420-dependent enzyme